MILTLLTLTTALLPAAAQQAKPKVPPKKPPVKKQPALGVLGTEQAKGGDGLFGTTYTVENSGGYRYNITIVSAEYAVARHNINKDVVLVPKTQEKLLILHLRAQNPKPGDEYFGGNFVTFSTVAKDDQTRNHDDYLRLVSAKDNVSTTLKAGQKFPEELLAACIVPAKGPVPKLILNIGRVGTNEEVVRYFLGKAPNTVTPLTAPFADPSDPTGSTALEEIKGTLGTAFPSGYFDMSLDSVSFAPGPIGDNDPGEGKRYLVAAVTLTNRTWNRVYFNNSSIVARLKTSDDEKADEFLMLKGKRDEAFEGRKVDPDESFTVRLLFTVPKDVTGTTLRLAETVDNTGGQGHAALYDVSGIK